MKFSPWLFSFALLGGALSVASLGMHCASITALVVSNEALRAVGDEFVTCAAAMDAGLDAGRISPQQYRDWAHFGAKFRDSYGPAVALWKAARAANDAKLEAKAAAVVGHLADELSGFTAQAHVASVSMDGGFAGVTLVGSQRFPLLCENRRSIRRLWPIAQMGG